MREGKDTETESPTSRGLASNTVPYVSVAGRLHGYFRNIVALYAHAKQALSQFTLGEGTVKVLLKLAALSSFGHPTVQSHQFTPALRLFTYM